jgi:hypothetical protein
MKHRWSKHPVRFEYKTERACDRGCGLVKVTRHEWQGGREKSWTEYWRDLDRVDDGKSVPVCEPVEQRA